MKRLDKVFGVSVGGSSYEQATGWVQTMMSIPADQNPLVDETGEYAYLGDTGDVHYLAGNFGGTTERAFDVDLGDTLVLPLLNTWSDEFSAVYEDLTEDALFFLDFFNLQTVYLRIDLDSDGIYEYGTSPVPFDVSKASYFPDIDFKGDSKRAEKFFVAPEDEFVFSYPDDNVYGYPVPPNASNSATAGYYATIEDLPEGTHTIEFGGTALVPGGEGEEPFLVEIDIIDVITVVDNSVSALEYDAIEFDDVCADEAAMHAGSWQPDACA